MSKATIGNYNAFAPFQFHKNKTRMNNLYIHLKQHRHVFPAILTPSLFRECDANVTSRVSPVLYSPQGPSSHALIALYLLRPKLFSHYLIAIVPLYSIFAIAVMVRICQIVLRLVLT